MTIPKIFCFTPDEFIQMANKSNLNLLHHADKIKDGFWQRYLKKTGKTFVFLCFFDRDDYFWWIDFANKKPMTQEAKWKFFERMAYLVNQYHMEDLTNRADADMGELLALHQDFGMLGNVRADAKFLGELAHIAENMNGALSGQGMKISDLFDF
jgi:hypothetical protein